jgi:hypothetical protein
VPHLVYDTPKDQDSENLNLQIPEEIVSLLNESVFKIVGISVTVCCCVGKNK